jgi:hypothetical protein
MVGTTAGTTTPLRIRLDRQAWTEIAQERFAIMHIDGGIPEPLAKEKALADTTKNFGPRPPERKNP